MLRSGVKNLVENRKKIDLKNETADFSNFSYFTHELLDHIDADLLNFLIGVSILDEFNEEAANYILKIDYSDKYIKACEKKGLFLQITSADVFVYRFHPLFRNALTKISIERLSGKRLLETRWRLQNTTSVHRISERRSITSLRRPGQTSLRI